MQVEIPKLVFYRLKEFLCDFTDEIVAFASFKLLLIIPVPYNDAFFMKIPDENDHTTWTGIFFINTNKELPYSEKNDFLTLEVDIGQNYWDKFKEIYPEVPINKAVSDGVTLMRFFCETKIGGHELGIFKKEDIKLQNGVKYPL